MLRLKRARNPDAVAMALLEGWLDRLAKRDVHVVVCGVREELYDAFVRTGLADRLGDGQVFREQPVRQTSTLLAIRHAYELVDQPCETCAHRRDAARGETALYYAV